MRSIRQHRVNRPVLNRKKAECIETTACRKTRAGEWSKQTWIIRTAASYTNTQSKLAR